VHFILIEHLFNHYLSYVTFFQCYFDRSHETGLTVVIIQCYFGRSHDTGLTVAIIQSYFDRSHETGLTVVAKVMLN
jgi:hypothetical protein